MPLYEIGPDAMTEVGSTSFEAAKLKERSDLQRLLREKIEVIVPDSMVLAEEFSDWDDSRRSIDLLVLDQDANLVVVELKRTTDGGHMELQAIRYAAMISAMTFQQAVDAHAQFLRKIGIHEDPEPRILEFLGWEEPDEDAFAQDVRIVLASADFGKELTTAVLWLNERGLDIRCVRMVPYAYEGRTLVHIEQVIPLPEAEEYQIRVREKATQERVARQGQGTRSDRNLRFWAGLLEKANDVLPLHRNVSPSKDNWIAATAHGLLYSYVTSHGKGRVELYIQRSTRTENKLIFDAIHAHRDAIETAFGEKLSWQRLDHRRASRIASEIDGGNVLDERTWDGLQAAMVDGMCRLERALRPFVETYRSGGSPPTLAPSHGDVEASPVCAAPGAEPE